MRITPLDVRKQEFRRVVRGLDADEVYAFLTTVADEYEAVLSDNKQLREKVIDLDEKVSEYRNMETTLRDTLLTAERVMSEARQNARKEAELILRDASVRASEQTASISSQVDKLKGQLRELRGQRDSFLARLQSLAESQIGLAESYRRDFEREERGEIEHARTDEARADESARIAPPEPDPIPESEITIPKPEDLMPELSSRSQEEEVEEPTTDRRDSEDQWRGYEVGAPARSAPQSRPAPRPTEPETRSTEPENTSTEPEANAREDTAGVEAAVELALDSEPDRPSQSPENTEKTQTAERAPAPPVETQVDALPENPDDPSQEDPVDRVARMMAEAGGDAGIHLSGQDEEAVASSSAPEEPELAETSDDDGSRWSLSRFTKGLSNF